MGKPFRTATGEPGDSNNCSVPDAFRVDAGAGVGQHAVMSLLFACLAAVAIDGDTLRCADLPAELASQGGRVRIARIDTPERGEPGFEEAKSALAALIAGRAVTCELVDADPRTAGFQARDRFGRPVARCSAGGRELGAAQIAAGVAEVWPRVR